MQTGILDESLCYLIGAMECASDNGISWRAELIQLCKSKDLKIKFLDPTNKVRVLQKEIGEEREKNAKLKRDGSWEELTSFMKIVVRQDHRCVDLSDFVIFYLDPTLHTCGSYFEFQSTLTQKKPYFIIVPQGKSQTPSWLFGICDHTKIFDNIEQVVDQLVALNNGSEPLSDRWVLFRKQINEI